MIRSVAVGSPAGLHARAAAQVAAAAAARSVPVTVRVDNRPAVPADSVLSLLSLGATGGTELILEADGPGAASALEALADLISAGPDRAALDAAALDAAARQDAAGSDAARAEAREPGAAGLDAPEPGAAELDAAGREVAEREAAEREAAGRG